MSPPLPIVYLEVVIPLIDKITNVVTLSTNPMRRAMCKVAEPSYVLVELCEFHLRLSGRWTTVMDGTHQDIDGNEQSDFFDKERERVGFPQTWVYVITDSMLHSDITNFLTVNHE